METQENFQTTFLKKNKTDRTPQQQICRFNLVLVRNAEPTIIKKRLDYIGNKDPVVEDPISFDQISTSRDIIKNQSCLQPDYQNTIIISSNMISSMITGALLFKNENPPVYVMDHLQETRKKGQEHYPLGSPGHQFFKMKKKMGEEFMDTQTFSFDPNLLSILKTRNQLIDFHQQWTGWQRTKQSLKKALGGWSRFVLDPVFNIPKAVIRRINRNFLNRDYLEQKIQTSKQNQTSNAPSLNQSSFIPLTTRDTYPFLVYKEPYKEGNLSVFLKDKTGLCQIIKNCETRTQYNIIIITHENIIRDFIQETYDTKIRNIGYGDVFCIPNCVLDRENGCNVILHDQCTWFKNPVQKKTMQSFPYQQDRKRKNIAKEDLMKTLLQEKKSPEQSQKLRNQFRKKINVQIKARDATITQRDYEGFSTILVDLDRSGTTNKTEIEFIFDFCIDFILKGYMYMQGMGFIILMLYRCGFDTSDKLYKFFIRCNLFTIAAGRIIPALNIQLKECLKIWIPELLDKIILTGNFSNEPDLNTIKGFGSKDNISALKSSPKAQLRIQYKVAFWLFLSSLFLLYKENVKDQTLLCEILNQSQNINQLISKLVTNLIETDLEINVNFKHISGKLNQLIQFWVLLKIVS